MFYSLCGAGLKVPSTSLPTFKTETHTSTPSCQTIKARHFRGLTHENHSQDVHGSLAKIRQVRVYLRNVRVPLWSSNGLPQDAENTSSIAKNVWILAQTWGGTTRDWWGWLGLPWDMNDRLYQRARVAHRGQLRYVFIPCPWIVHTHCNYSLSRTSVHRREITKPLFFTLSSFC